MQHKDRVAWALIFGECIHFGLQGYYTKNRRKVKDALTWFNDAWAREDYLLQQKYGALYSLGIEEEWCNWRETGRTMLTYYDMYDKQSEFQWDKVLYVANVEERIFADILDPSGDHLEGLPLLSGRPDLVVERKDGIWVVDHKTAASAYDARALDIDDQLTGLCYLWYRNEGVVVRGALYNALIKSPPSPPRLLKDGSLSKAKDQRTTYDLYIQALKDNGFKRTDPDYREILNFLREKGWRQFFLRDVVHRNIEELMSFENRLYNEYLDMSVAAQDEEKAYPNPSQFNCPGCGVLPICQAMEEQGRVDWLRETSYVVEEPRVTIPDEILHPDWKGV